MYNPNLDNKAIRFLSYLVALWVYQLLFPWVTIIKFVSGVGNLLLTTKYAQGHVTQWKSQPQTHVRAKSVTILFTGNTHQNYKNYMCCECILFLWKIIYERQTVIFCSLIYLTRLRRKWWRSMWLSWMPCKIWQLFINECQNKLHPQFPYYSHAWENHNILKHCEHLNVARSKKAKMASHKLSWFYCFQKIVRDKKSWNIWSIYPILVTPVIWTFFTAF